VTVIATQKLDDKDKQVGIFFDRNRLRSCLEIRIVARWRSNCGPARRDGGKNKDCSELHDAIFAPVVTQGRNSGATRSRLRVSKQLLRVRSEKKRDRGNIFEDSRTHSGLFDEKTRKYGPGLG
ncbi:MAG: hypothetical protein BECKG1743D_GA0114223_113063, partial [Candidatus Kentron sp. G]